jgi:hypothetical protein
MNENVMLLGANDSDAKGEGGEVLALLCATKERGRRVKEGLTRWGGVSSKYLDPTQSISTPRLT